VTHTVQFAWRVFFNSQAVPLLQVFFSLICVKGDFVATLRRSDDGAVVAYALVSSSRHSARGRAAVVRRVMRALGGTRLTEADFGRMYDAVAAELRWWG
jgi:hypothetical protein